MNTMDLVFGIPPLVAALVGSLAWWLRKPSLQLGGLVSLITSALIAIFVIFIHMPSDPWVLLLLLIQYPSSLSAIILFWSEPSSCGLDKF